MQIDRDRIFTGHRPEVVTLLREIEGSCVSIDEFVMRYRSLGIQKTSPAKGRGLFRYLARVGFISTVTTNTQ